MQTQLAHKSNQNKQNLCLPDQNAHDNVSWAFTVLSFGASKTNKIEYYFLKKRTIFDIKEFLKFQKKRRNQTLKLKDLLNVKTC